jgi:hypothetical protein
MGAFALDSSHDIYITSGQLARVTGADFVAQKITTQLRMYLGEWWLNQLAGTPWFQRILVNPADIASAETILKQTISRTPGVVRIESLSVDFDATARDFSIVFSALTDQGSTGEVSVSG